jgi:cation transport protein ChaC
MTAVVDIADSMQPPQDELASREASAPAEKRTAGCGASAGEASTSSDEILIFGYGSLIWRPCDHLSSFTGYIRGYRRRFWQASPDHRGTPSHLGRVCTLVRAEDAAEAAEAGEGEREGGEAVAVTALSEVVDVAADAARASRAADVPVVHGTVFRISEETLADLCFRERAGYLPERVPVIDDEGKEHVAYVFTATERGEFAVWGEATHATAAVIATARGLSGSNYEYFKGLLHAMRERGVRDEYLEELELEIRKHPAFTEQQQQL